MVRIQEESGESHAEKSSLSDLTPWCWALEPLRSHRSRQKAEDDSSHYDEIVVFSKDDDIICADMSSTDICRTDIENAKAGLLALNLSEQGLAALEAACLNELDTMANL